MRSQSRVRLLISVLVIAGAWTARVSADEVLPAGTVLNVRTTEPIYIEAARPGMSFPAVVDDPVVDVGGRTVVQRGSQATIQAVSVQRSSNMKGRDRIMFKVSAVRANGRVYHVTSSQAEVKGPSEGKRAARKMVGGAGIGAAVGGLLGGGSGAAFGAAAGGTTGAVVAGSGKTHLTVPAETRLQFRLSAPARIQR